MSRPIGILNGVRMLPFSPSDISLFSTARSVQQALLADIAAQFGNVPIRVEWVQIVSQPYPYELIITLGEREEQGDDGFYLSYLCEPITAAARYEVLKDRVLFDLFRILGDETDEEDE